MREKREKKIFLNSSVKNVSIIRKDPDKEEGCERERRYAQGFLFPFLYSWKVLNMHGFLRTKHFKSGIQFAQCWNDWMDLPTRKHLKTCDLTHSISTCTDSTSNARGTLRVWTLSRCPGHLATHLQSDSVKQVLLFSQLTSMRLLPTGRGLTVWAGIPPHVTSRAHLWEGTWQVGCTGGSWERRHKCSLGIGLFPGWLLCSEKVTQTMPLTLNVQIWFVNVPYFKKRCSGNSLAV